MGVFPLKNRWLAEPTVKLHFHFLYNRYNSIAFFIALVLYCVCGLYGTDKYADTGLYPFADATRTPRGDGNILVLDDLVSVFREDATRTPRGDGNFF